jgi:hypothetical protein
LVTTKRFRRQMGNKEIYDVDISGADAQQPDVDTVHLDAAAVRCQAYRFECSALVISELLLSLKTIDSNGQE